jgi:hypothetical protein
MTTTLRDVFTRRANEIGAADLDLDELIGLGEHRLRRRRIIATVGAAAAVLLAVAVGVGGAVLNHSADSDPTTHPKNDQPPPSRPAERPLVYTDDTGGRLLKGGAVEIQVGVVHVGDRVVDVGQISHYVRGWALRVTDDGIVYVQGDDSSVWFSDGGRPQQIAERNCFNADHFGGIATGTNGSYAAWFDCTSASRGDLVVYDTAAGDEAARLTIPVCRPRWSWCMADAVVGDHVYFTRMWNGPGGPGPRHDGTAGTASLMVDLATGHVAGATPQQLDGDLRTQPRAIVLGDSWDTGTAVSHEALERSQIAIRFDTVGSHLVPVGDDRRRTRAFDSATGKALQLRLPSGYELPEGITFPDGPGEPPQPENRYFTSFQWLDDETIALIQNQTRDIIACNLKDGACDVSVKGVDIDEVTRMVPGSSFPG